MAQNAAIYCRFLEEHLVEYASIPVVRTLERLASPLPVRDVIPDTTLEASARRWSHLLAESQRSYLMAEPAKSCALRQGAAIPGACVEWRPRQESNLRPTA